MGKRGLHAVHLIHDDLLHLPAGHIHDRPKGQLRQLFQYLLPDVLQNGKGRLMGHGQCHIVKKRACGIPRQSQT